MSKDEMLALTISGLIKNPEISKTEQLKLFNELSGIIEKEYLYPDFRGLDWPVIVNAFRTKVESGLDTETFYAEMEQFIMSLGDKHSTFESPVKAKEVSAQLAGHNNFVGVGALFQGMKKSKQVTILAVLPGSPAEQSGLKQHDIILEVDGLPLVKDEKTFPYTRGPACSMATLTVRSPGKAIRKVKVIRAQVTSPMPVYARWIPDPGGRRIGYIFLPTFLDLTIPEQVKKALENFGPLDGLVLDNRMNRGGSGKVISQVLGFFTKDTVGHFINRTAQRPFFIPATPIHNSQYVPLVVLVSNNTVSYAEVFSGVIQDLGRGKIIGETTAGKVETLHAYLFKDGSKLWLANESFEPVNSQIDWQDRGVRPDIEVIAEWDEFTFENDPALAVALKLFPKK